MLNYIPFIKVKIMAAREENKVIDPLQFWSDEGKTKFPILARIASLIFSANATSGETERIASTAGIFYSPRRNKFKPETVKQMIFLHGCYIMSVSVSVTLAFYYIFVREFNLVF